MNNSPKTSYPLWTMAFRNVLRRPRRSLLSVTAIGLAALTMTCLFALVGGLKADMGNNIQRYSTGQVLIEDKALAKSGVQPLGLAIGQIDALKGELAARPGVAALSARITGGASVFQNGDAVFFPLMGLEFATDPIRLKAALLAGGELPQSGERQALITSSLAQKLGLTVGSTLTVVTQTLRGSSNGMTFTVTGIVQPGLSSFAAPWLFTSLATTQRLVKLTDGATSLLVTTQPQADAVAVARDLQTVLTANQPDKSARAWFETSSTYGLMDLAGIVYAFIGIVFVALASTVIINTMLMVVLERAREIGMLSAMGMDWPQLRNLFLAESAILSGFGAAVGTLLGSAISLLLSATGIDFTESLKGVSLDISGVLRPILEPYIPVVVFVIATLVALLFTLVPIHRIKKLEIVEALRGEV